MGVRLIVLAALLGLVASGAASGGGKPTIDDLLHRHGPDVALVLGASDFARGDIRVSFLVVASNGKPVDRPRARVWVGTARNRTPIVETTAVLEPIGVPGASQGDDADITSIYVAHFRLPRAARYIIVAEPVGGSPIQGYQYLDVKNRPAAPAVGSAAYPSRSPTIRSAHGKLSALTTRVPPDKALLRVSIADALEEHRPFVVVFATPKFCVSRTCGPVVDVVDAVRQKFSHSPIRFIHVEIYRDNDPSKGPNTWVQQWHLPSEPWIFLVGRDGRIKERFEGSVSVDELAAAVRAKLAR